MRESTGRSAESSNEATWKRVAKTAAGGTLLAVGLKRRTWPGYAAAFAGGWLAYRGLASGDRDIELVSLEEIEASAEAVDVERSLRMRAPITDVRDFLSEPANLDDALDVAGRIEPLDETRQRWTLQSPTGHALTWEMRREDMGSEDELRWVSTGDVDLEIGLEMEAIGDDTTEVTMTLSVEPPGGSIGQAVVERLDVVPHALVAGFLRRTKRLVETQGTQAGPVSSTDRPPAPDERSGEDPGTSTRQGLSR